jgi:hypothetical protein
MSLEGWYKVNQGRHLVLLLMLGLTGCLAIPYPHKIVPYSHITGRIIDANTGAPVAGAIVGLSQGHASRETDSNGNFEFKPEEEWRLFFNLPLLPFEFWWMCGDDLVIEGPYEPGKEIRYRRQAIQVNSCPVPFFLAYSRRENLSIRGDLGDIPLRPLPADAPRE